MTLSGTSRTAALSGVVLALLLPLTGCGGDKTPASDKSPKEALALAKKTFDNASSVHLTLATTSVPTKGDAVLGADGTLTHQPAFEGKVTVVLGGFHADVPVVAVGDKVYAKLPLTLKYSEIDPSEYSAPNPADFADTDKGISGLLLKMKGLEEDGQERDGKVVLTRYSGTLAGSYVEPIIPSASGARTYKTVVGIDQDGRILSLKVTGDFFPADGDVTYNLTFDNYDKNVKITAP